MIWAKLLVVQMRKLSFRLSELHWLTWPLAPGLNTLIPVHVFPRVNRRESLSKDVPQFLEMKQEKVFFSRMGIESKGQNQHYQQQKPQTLAQSLH